MRRIGQNLSAILLYAAFVSLVFTGVVIGRGVFFAGDISQHYVPWESQIDEELESGNLPMWSDGFFGGHPVFAEGQSGILYPVTRIVYRLFDGAQAFSIDMLIHLILAGFFLYLFARRLNLGFYPSLYAGAVFALAGYPVSLIVNAPILRSVIWVPLIVNLVWGIWQKPGLRGALFLTLAFVIQIFAGSLQVVAMTSVLVLFLSIILLVGKILTKKFSPIPILMLLAIVLPLTIFISSVQTIPTYELYQRSFINLDAGNSEAISYSFSPYHLLDMIIPPYWAQDKNVLDNESIPFQMTLFLYIGFIPFLMTLIAFLFSRVCGTWKILAVIGILMGLGGHTFFYPMILKLLPFLNSFRAPDRFLFIYSMSASILAGYGFRMILGRELPMDPAIKRRWLIVSGIIVLILLAGGFAIDSFLPGTIDKFFANLRFSVINPSTVASTITILASIISSAFLNLVIAFLLLAALIAAVIVLRKHPEKTIILGAIIFLLSFCEVGYYLKANPGTRLINPSFYTDPPQSVQAIHFNEGRSVPGIAIDETSGDSTDLEKEFDDEKDLLFRISVMGAGSFSEKVFGELPLLLWYHGGGTLEDFTTFREILNPNFGNIYDLNYISGISSLYTSSWNDFIVMLETQEDIYSQNPEFFRSKVHLWDLAGVKYIVSDTPLQDGRLELRHEGDVYVYQNKRCLDRAFVIYPEKVLPETRQVLDALTFGNLDPVKNLILQTGKESFYSRDPFVINQSSSPVIIDEYSPSRVRLSGIALSDGYLVLTDTFYPGWICRINNEPSKIYRAYGYFRAVPIKSGRFEAVFEFKPSTFTTGFFISLTGAIIWLVLFALTLIHRGGKKEVVGLEGVEEYDDNDFPFPYSNSE